MGTPGVLLDITKDDISDALIRNKGIVSKCAREFGCARETFLNHVYKDKELVELMAAMRAEPDRLYLDLAEDNVISFLEDRHYPMTTYVLDKKGKSRNWTQEEHKADELNRLIALERENRALLAKLQAYHDASQASQVPLLAESDRSESNDQAQS